jgi:hypothetical protein
MTKTKHVVQSGFKIDTIGIINDGYTVGIERDFYLCFRLSAFLREKLVEVIRSRKRISKGLHRGVHGIIREIDDCVSKTDVPRYQ